MQHTISLGDNLSAIARRHGLTLEAGLSANPVLRANLGRISVDRVIILPNNDAVSAPSTAPAPAAPSAPAGT